MKKRFIILISVFLLIIFSFLFNEKRNKTYIESIIKDSYLNTIMFIDKPYRNILNKIKKYSLNKEIYDEYIELKDIKEKYDSLNNSINYYKNEIKNLNDLLELNNKLDYELINSKVINRNIGKWYDTITIDKGKNSNIKIGDTVINNKGLVGEVISTTNNTSVVKLLTNFDNKISVIISSDKNYYGLLYDYNEKENIFFIEGISSDNNISIGLPVMISGMGNLKQNILVGSIKDIIKDPYELSVNLKITPYVDFNDIDYVSIIK